MNNKIKLLTLSLSIAGLFVIVFILRKPNWVDEVEKREQSTSVVVKKDQTATKQSKTEKEKSKPTTPGAQPQFNQNLRLVEDSEEENLSFLDMDAIEELFDEVEEQWAQKIKGLFIEQLGLSEEVYQKYQALRDEYDIAKLEAFEAYHERMIEQHGPNYPYQPTLQVEEFDNTALPEFYKRLEAQIGLDALRQYIRLKDDFNEELRRNQPPGPAQILIDF